MTATLKTELLPQQQRVIDRLKTQPGLVVAHGLGSGKTLASIGAAADNPGKTLALVPASLLENYKKEVKKHTTGLKNLEIESAQGEVRNQALNPTDLLIVDEAHRARELNTKLHQLIRDYPASKRMLLTASPVYNRPSDIASLVNLAAGYRALPTGSEFDYYHVQKPKAGILRSLIFGAPKTKLKNTGGLSRQLEKWVDYYPSEGKDFPSRIDTQTRVPMTTQQTLVHDAALGQLPWMTRLRMQAGLPADKKDLARLNAFQSQTRQVGGSVNRFTNDEGLKTVTPKIQTAVRDLMRRMETNPEHRAVIYSNYLDTLNDYKGLLDHQNIASNLYTGDLPKKKRDQAVRDFNAGKLKALLVSSAGGEGLDLQGTRQVQVLEPHWNEEKLKQVIGRAIRRGSHAHLPEDQRNVEVQRFITYPESGFIKKLLKQKRTGIEDYLYNKSQDKEQLNQQLIQLLEDNRLRMTKTAEEIAEDILVKISIDLPALRAAMSRSLVRGKNFVRGGLGAAESGVLLRRRLKQIPKDTHPIGWGAVTTDHSRSLKNVGPAWGTPQDVNLTSLLDPKKHLADNVVVMSNSPLDALKKITRNSKDYATNRPSTFTPEMHEATNRIFGLHEVAERASLKGKSTIIQNPESLWNPRTVSHLSPEVMLQEHNMIQTLPPELHPVKEYIKDLRQRLDTSGTYLTFASDNLKTKQPFVYGESPRVNRRMRKEMTNAVYNLHKDPEFMRKLFS